MKNVIGVFDTGLAARDAIKALHAAGFQEDDIAFVLEPTQEQQRPTGAEQSARTGHQLGELAADAGETLASFLPFVGRNLVESPLGQALRTATETTASSGGRLLGALSDGGFTADQTTTMTRARRDASVVVRVADERAGQAMAILAEAGASAVESSVSESR